MQTDDEQHEEKKWDVEEEAQNLLKLATPPILCEPNGFMKITKLNLAECGLTSLPYSLPEIVPHLSILFCPKNRFTELPAVVGSCPNLQMISFKTNGMKTIHPEALQPQLRWLILTDNAVGSLPSTIGRCHKLQKLMLSGNKVERVPEEISNCTQLELVRLASNRLEEPPMPLLRLPNLSWIALSDNPFLSRCSNAASHSELEVFDDGHLDDPTIGEVLGTGASGITKRTMLNNTLVAVKNYQGAITSDGNPAEERRLSLAASSLKCDCLIQVLGQTPKGSLVMELLRNYTALAGPPSFESCSRDVYSSDATMTVTEASSMVSGLLTALAKLHENGIFHGDFYGHNILVSQDDPTKVKLSDFGAAFFYSRNSEYGTLLEKIEMRSFGHLVEEVLYLLKKSETEDPATQLCGVLNDLASACRDEQNTFASLGEKWQVDVDQLAN